MNKTIFSTGRALLCLASVSLLGISCAKESSPVKTTTWHVEASASGMKTVLDGKDVLWTEDDLLACICYDGEPKPYSVAQEIKPATIDGKNATFDITVQSGMTPRILVNPSANGIAYAAGRITIPVPSSYKASAGTVPEGSLISVGAIGEDGHAFMRNVMSFLKVVIESEDINRVVLRSNAGEPLSGKIVFDMETLQALEGKNSEAVELLPADEEEGVFAPGTYYIPVPACTCEEGLTLRLYRSDGSAAKKVSSDAYTVNRNKFIDMGTESEWNLVFFPATISFTVVFKPDDSSSVWPFVDENGSSTAPSVSSVQGKGRFGPFYPAEGPEYPFYFQVHNTSGSKSYFTSQGTYGLRLGGTIGDYITIPGIPSYRLTSLYFEEGSSTSYYYISTDTDEGEVEYLTSNKVTINKNTNKTFTFTAEQTTAGATYRLCTAATNPSAVKKLIFNYEIVD